MSVFVAKYNESKESYTYYRDKDKQPQKFANDNEAIEFLKATKQYSIEQIAEFYILDESGTRLKQISEVLGIKLKEIKTQQPSNPVGATTTPAPAPAPSLAPKDAVTETKKETSLSPKDMFLKIYNEHITRPGADKFLEWLQSTDFFTAPASTRFHLCCETGLNIHSNNVYSRLASRNKENKFTSEESVAIVGLLHDVCKANFYIQSCRNVKTYHDKGSKFDSMGKFDWIEKLGYEVEEQFAFGHGEKSVYLIMKHMSLTDEEATAIRYHMGGYDAAVKGGDQSISNAYRMYPLAVHMSMADMEATYLDECDDNH